VYIVRSIAPEDLDEIYELSLLMQFINVPSDKKILEKMISKSCKSFETPKKNISDNLFMFVCEDLNLDKVIGVSLIHGIHGTKEEPHFFLRVGQEHKYSKSLNTGFIHGTLKFGHTSEGFSEIGGLVLDPGYRGHAYKLGKALSFSRFLFMGLHPELFTDTVHVELMPPFDSKGKSPLWEAIGRRFLNMDYHEADLLSRKNKEFILSLYPRDTIYEALLPIEARNAIGKVGEQTLPVKRMLESIGFYYAEEVDPFDGGPHYRARLKDISIIKDMTKVKIEKGSPKNNKLHMVNLINKEHPFYAPLLQGERVNKKLIVEGETYKELYGETGKGISY
jgi:arginine N-succinyltransferase